MSARLNPDYSETSYFLMKSFLLQIINLISFIRIESLKGLQLLHQVHIMRAGITRNISSPLLLYEKSTKHDDFTSNTQK